MLFDTFGPLVLSCTSDQQKIYTLFIETSNELPSLVLIGPVFSEKIEKKIPPFLTTLGLLFLLCTSNQQKILSRDYPMNIPTKYGFSSSRKD